MIKNETTILVPFKGFISMSVNTPKGLQPLFIKDAFAKVKNALKEWKEENSIDTEEDILEWGIVFDNEETDEK